MLVLIKLDSMRQPYGWLDARKWKHPSKVGFVWLGFNMHGQMESKYAYGDISKIGLHRWFVNSTKRETSMERKQTIVQTGWNFKVVNFKMKCDIRKYKRELTPFKILNYLKQ